jgi:hypothetical protein
VVPGCRCQRNRHTIAKKKVWMSGVSAQLGSATSCAVGVPAVRLLLFFHLHPKPHTQRNQTTSMHACPAMTATPQPTRISFLCIEPKKRKCLGATPKLASKQASIVMMTRIGGGVNSSSSISHYKNRTQ